MNPRLKKCISRTTLALLTITLGANTSKAVTIMPMGDSITVGADFLTNTSGGYRDPLSRDLTAAGVSFSFVGANNSNATPALTAGGETYHNGYGAWHIQDLNNNLERAQAPLYGGDSNMGGYFLTGGHGTGRQAVSPDILLLEIGTNDLLQGNPNTAQDLFFLVTHIHALSPNTIILIAGITPINSPGFVPVVLAYDAYIQNILVPSLPYTRYVDQSSSFFYPNGSVNGALLGSDLVHPDRFGYPILASNWAKAIEAVVGTSKSTYALSVTSGFGSGSYPSGSVVTVGANPAAAGSQFASWTPGTTALSNPYSTLAIYTMPAAASTLTATYAAAGNPLIPDGTYNLSSYYDGLSVASASAAEGSLAQQQTFTSLDTQKWDLANLGGNIVTLTLSGTSEALEVPSASSPVLGADLDISTYRGQANQQWLINPILGTTELVNVSSGLVVNIQGYSSSPGAQLVQSTAGYSVNQLWSFYPLSGPPAVYTLTVTNGTGSGSYASNSTVVVTANNPASGYRFSGWAGNTSALANPLSARTTLTMPPFAASIYPTYLLIPQTYALTVTGGSGSGAYLPGTQVPVTAGAPAAGYQFNGWAGYTVGLSNPASSTTIVTMPSAAASISATYTAIAVPPPAGTNLGQYSLLDESAQQGNSMSVSYGASAEGQGMNTYWRQNTDNMKVVSMGSNQYEIVETLGNRCVTVVNSSVKIHTCTGRSSQLFRLNLQPDGSYTVQSGSVCVRSAQAFTNIDAQPCSSAVDQRWMFSGVTSLNLGTAPVIPPVPPVPPPVGTSLGQYSLLDESAAQGNSMTVLYGVSREGGGLITYWHQGGDIIEVVSMGSGLYELVETLGSRCVTVTGSSVKIATCTGSLSQLLTLALQSDGSYTIQSGGTCVRSSQGFSAIDAQPCSSSIDQRWNFSGTVPLDLGGGAATALPPPPPLLPVPTSTNLGQYSLLDESASRGNSLTLLYGSSFEGANLTTYWSQSTPIVKVLSMGSNQYELVETLGSRCITISGSSVTITTCTGAAAQLLGLNLQSDGSYTIQSGGLCLGAAGAFTTVDAQPCDSAADKRWQFSGVLPLVL